jgi:exodeoxyribonuclease-5
MTTPTTVAQAMTFSPDQEAAIAAIQAWAGSDRKHFRLGGLAGCGKTTIAAMLPSLLGTGSIQFCAPTGRAASVLTRKMGTEARTLHSLLYIAESYTTHNEECVCTEKHAQHPETFKCVDDLGQPVGGCERVGCFCPSSIVWHKRSDMLCECYGDEKCALHRNPLADILVVDEASMVGKTLFEDVCELPCRVIWVGDYGQLPPVMDGKGVLSEANLDAKLTQIHRQADNPEGSNIVDLAHAVRAYGKNAAHDWTGPGVTIKRMPITAAKLKADPNRLVLCWKNKTRVLQNAAMRRSMGYPENIPVVGDKIICLRNNREAKVYNGQLGTIAAIEDDRPYTYKVTVNMEDGNVFVGDIVKAQFGQEKPLNDGYGNLFDFGYCITTHKSQGSEADEVVVLAEGANFNGEPAGAQDPKWLYTAVTRAKKTLTVVLP